MSKYATQAYKNVGVNTAVEGATPHKLVLMLYDGLLRQLRLARAHMQKGDLGQKASCVSKAISIIDQGLRASLNDEKGGEIALRLRALYDYSERQLVHANARNDVAVIDEVIALFEPLRAAWHGIAGEVGEPPASQAAPRGAVR
ncbi:MAG TPA: flagellar export chaperone FliS [Polyangiales bacterium]|nr:flagellar export chaperone FliS [Polyangiales bacterium]